MVSLYLEGQWDLLVSNIIENYSVGGSSILIAI